MIEDCIISIHGRLCNLSAVISSVLADNFSQDEYPHELKQFMKDYPPDLAYTEEESLFANLHNFSIPEIRDIVSKMPGGMWRAEMRGYLKQREREENEKSAGQT